MKKLTREEWIKEGRKRFGKFVYDWSYKCPACGRINNTKEFLNLNADINDAYINCIGRFNGKGVSGLSVKKEDYGKIKSGCDWASYGLLGTLDKGLIVIDDEGKEVQVFDFADN